MRIRDVEKPRVQVMQQEAAAFETLQPRRRRIGWGHEDATTVDKHSAEMLAARQQYEKRNTFSAWTSLLMAKPISEAIQIASLRDTFDRSVASDILAQCEAENDEHRMPQKGARAPAAKLGRAWSCSCGTNDNFGWRTQCRTRGKAAPRQGRTFADVAGAPGKREKQLSAQLAQLQEKFDKLVSSQAPAAPAKVEADVDIQQLVNEHQAFLKKYGEARADRDKAKLDDAVVHQAERRQEQLRKAKTAAEERLKTAQEQVAAAQAAMEVDPESAGFTPEEQEERKCLDLWSFNGPSWGTLKDRILDASGTRQVLAVQEHHLAQNKFEGVRQSMLRQGWQLEGQPSGEHEAVGPFTGQAAATAERARASNFSRREGRARGPRTGPRLDRALRQILRQHAANDGADAAGGLAAQLRTALALERQLGRAQSQAGANVEADVIDRAAKREPLVEPEDDAPQGGTRESERLSFHDYRRVRMCSAIRWSRFYRTMAPRRGQVRMYPKKKNDTSGIYVKLDHALLVGGIKRTGVLEKAWERPFEAELYLSNAHGYGASLSWFRSGLAGAWSSWSCGSTVGFAIFSGGVAVCGNLWRRMRWVMEELEDGHHSLLVADYVRGDWRDLYLGGRLESSIMIFTATVALGPSLWSCCQQMSSPRLAGETPPGIDMDSDGEAGPSRAGSSDESMPAKGMQERQATGSSLFDKIVHPRSGSRRARMSGMIDWWKRFEDTSKADKASQGCQHAQAASPTAATSGATTCPSIDLGTAETLVGAGGSPEPLMKVCWGPREQALVDLRKIDALSTVTRLAGPTSSVAQELRVKTYGANVSLGRSEASPEITQTARYENLGARVYALMRVFEDVAGIIDGKQPRDSGADKWTSRVFGDPTDELDWRSLTEGEEALTIVGRYSTARLQQRVLQHTYPQMEGSDAATEEDEKTGGWPFLETETLCRAGRCCHGRWAVGHVGAGDTAPEGYFEEGVVVSVDAGESARPPPETNPARTVDICPLVTEDLSDGTGRMPRKPYPAMEEELKGPRVHRDSSFRSRTFLPILVEKPWEARMLRTTDELVEGMPLFGVIQKCEREEADPLGPVRCQVRAIWDWWRANLPWQTPMHGPLGSSTTLTNLDLSYLGEADVVYTGVGDTLDRFDRFETPPDVWLYFVLEGLPLHGFFDYMRVLVKGRPRLLPLAYSRPKALTARRLWVDTGDARLVYGAPTHQLIGPVDFESGSWAYMDDYAVVASYASARQPVSEVMKRRGDRVVGRGPLMPTLHCLGQNRSHLWPDSGGAGAGGADMLDPGATVKLWAWAAISQRMGLAIRDSIYREMRRPETARTPFCLPDAARWGLTTMAYCATFRHTDLEAPWLSQVSMTGMADSKDNGHGVAVTEALLEEIRTATGYTEMRGWTIATDVWAPHVGGCAYDVDELADASATPPLRVRRGVNQALYLFAGRRREGDLEVAIYTNAECDGYDIQIWSIDSVIEPKHDRPNDELVSAILGQMRDGHFHAVIALPPCSTWSRSCFLKERPRPPRTRLEPWGRSDILFATFEHLRLDPGARLLLTAMQAVRGVCRTGGLCLTDHPADPEEDLYTSVGNPPERACFGEEAGGQIHQIDQGCYGASPMESTMKGIFGVYDDALDLAVGRLRPRGDKGPRSSVLAGLSSYDDIRAAEARDNYEKETYLGIREGGSTRRFTRLVPDVITAQRAPKVRDILSCRADKGWELRCKSAMGHALADYRDMKCYRDRPWPEEAIFAIADYVLEGGFLDEAIGALMQYDSYGQERDGLEAETSRTGGGRTNYSNQQRQLVDSNKTNLTMKKVKEVATELATTGWWRKHSDMPSGGARERSQARKVASAKQQLPRPRLSGERPPMPPMELSCPREATRGFRPTADIGVDWWHPSMPRGVPGDGLQQILDILHAVERKLIWLELASTCAAEHSRAWDCTSGGRAAEDAALAALLAREGDDDHGVDLRPWRLQAQGRLSQAACTAAATIAGSMFSAALPRVIMASTIGGHALQCPQPKWRAYVGDLSIGQTGEQQQLAKMTPAALDKRRGAWGCRRGASKSSGEQQGALCRGTEPQRGQLAPAPHLVIIQTQFHTNGGDAHARNAARRNAVSGPWTQALPFEVGLVDSPLCRACGAAPGALRYRYFCRKARRGARQKAPAERQRAAATQPGSLPWTADLARPLEADWRFESTNEDQHYARRQQSANGEGDVPNSLVPRAAGSSSPSGFERPGDGRQGAPSPPRSGQDSARLEDGLVGPSSSGGQGQQRAPDTSMGDDEWGPLQEMEEDMENARDRDDPYWEVERPAVLMDTVALAKTESQPRVFDSTGLPGMLRRALRHVAPLCIIHADHEDIVDGIGSGQAWRVSAQSRTPTWRCIWAKLGGQGLDDTSARHAEAHAAPRVWWALDEEDRRVAKGNEEAHSLTKDGAAIGAGFGKGKALENPRREIRWAPRNLGRWRIAVEDWADAGPKPGRPRPPEACQPVLYASNHTLVETGQWFRCATCGRSAQAL
ncbi:unnamed protein product, partial [Prorocentrum cordatum]